MAGFRKLNDHYIVETKISEGAFGVVYKGTDRVNGEVVALKKLKKIELDKNQVLPFTAKQEVKILEELNNHDNVIGFIEVVTCSDEKEVYLVFEYMEYDLAQLAKQMAFTPVDIKYYMRQLLTGLAYIHEKEVIHRDLKGDNILIDKDGKLKLADFGMSRFLKDGDTDTQSIVAGDFPESHALLGNLLAGFTNPIMAMPYRPPEILLGSTNYGPEVDIWAVGCIFAELLNRGSQIFPSQKNDDLQLQKIYEVCGTPDVDNWLEVYELPYFNPEDLPNPPQKSRVRDEFGHFDPDALELLDNMLVLTPCKRISAAHALAGTYFSTQP